MPNRKHIVVVVDDDAGMKQAIERLLNTAGFWAHSFLTAEALLASNAAADAACFILDVHLPGLSGFELYQRLLRSGVARPAIFISAYDEPVSQLQAKAAGAVAYITKPFEAHQLIAAVNQALGNSSGNPASRL